MNADVAELYRCRARDIDLLRSGSFSDVVVICGDREWKCHKAILTSRSVWFRKALAGPFEEAITGRVTLNEQDPECVDLALTHIYGLGLDVTFRQTPAHLFVVRAVLLWRTADFLQLTLLKTLVEKSVAHYCDERMKQLCTDGCEFKWSQTDADSDLSPWALDVVVGTLDAYKWHVSALKEVLMEFIWVGKKYTLIPAIAPTVLGHFKDTPDFMEDLISWYATGLWLYNPRWAAFHQEEIWDYRCDKTHTCVQCDKEVQIKNPFKLEGQHQLKAGWCSRCSLNKIPWRDCSPRPSIKDEIDEAV